MREKNAQFKRSFALFLSLTLFASCDSKESQEVNRQRQLIGLEKLTIETERRGLQLSQASFEEQKATFALEKSAFDQFKTVEIDRISERKKALEAERKILEQKSDSFLRDQARIMLHTDLRMLLKDFVSQKTGGFGNVLLGLVLSESEQESFIIDPLMQMISPELLVKSGSETESLVSSKDQRKAFLVTVLVKNKENITAELSVRFKQAGAFLNSILPAKAP